MKQVDKFFKDKLESHSATPPEGAWSKVEFNLSKKNNVIAWRIAAAILLIGALISVMLWQRENSEIEKSELAVKPFQKEIKKTIPKSDESKIKTQKQNTLAQSAKSKPDTRQNKSVGIKDEGESSKQKIKSAETEAAENPQSATKNSSKDLIEEKISTEATVKSEIASTRQKPIKLEFTLEEVASDESVATTNEVKNSGLKKVLALARDVKRGEGPLNIFRDKKNELFAHNFITGKTKSQ